MNLVGVFAEHTDTVWEAVGGWIDASCRRTDGVLCADYLRGLCRGEQAQLILAQDRDGVHAAAVTQMLRQQDGRLVCTILACGGRHVRDWVSLIEQIEDGARRNGAYAMRFIGRPGWRPFLASYRVRQLVYEKELNHGQL